MPPGGISRTSGRHCRTFPEGRRVSFPGESRKNLTGGDCSQILGAEGPRLNLADRVGQGTIQPGARGNFDRIGKTGPINQRDEIYRLPARLIHL